jgi:hypothetical protein
MTRSITPCVLLDGKAKAGEERLTPRDRQHLYGRDPVRGELRQSLLDEARSDAPTTISRVHDNVVEPREVHPVRPHGHSADRTPVQPRRCDEIA